MTWENFVEGKWMTIFMALNLKKSILFSVIPIGKGKYLEKYAFISAISLNMHDAPKEQNAPAINTHDSSFCL